MLAPAAAIAKFIVLFVFDGESVGSQVCKAAVDRILNAFDGGQDADQGRDSDGNDQRSKDGSEQIALNGAEAFVNIFPDVHGFKACAP